MKKTAVALFILALFPSTGWADSAVEEESLRNPTSLSVSVLGRVLGVSAEIETGLNDSTRAGVGISGGAAGQRGMVAVPVYLGLYPGGVDRHAFYLDIGVNLTRLSSCCGGADRGGSDGEFTMMPFGGFGYSFMGDRLMFKAGFETYLIIFPLPFIRVGYLF